MKAGAKAYLTARTQIKTIDDPSCEEIESYKIYDILGFSRNIEEIR